MEISPNGKLLSAVDDSGEVKIYNLSLLDNHINNINNNNNNINNNNNNINNNNDNINNNIINNNELINEINYVSLLHNENSPLSVCFLFIYFLIFNYYYYF